MSDRGVVAAGHPLTARAGADVLRAGGNAVDAALAALMTSFMAEPLLTGLGAGGYMLVTPPGAAPVLLDFMVAAPGGGERSPLDAVVIDFGDAVQVFHIGASSCGVYGMPSGVAEAAARFGTIPLTELAAPAIALAREGITVNHTQALLWDMLAPIGMATPESRARYSVDGRVPAEGDVMRDPELADAIERLAVDGAAPFYTGDIGCAVADWVGERGGTLSRDDLSIYLTIAREPVRVPYHGREVLTNPPPSAGGLLDRLRARRCCSAGQDRRVPPRSWRRWRPRRPSGRRRSSRNWGRPGSWRASCPHGSARRRTSRCSTPTAGRAR